MFSVNAMVRSSRDEGVYYRRQDYAGLWRRLLVSTVDAVVALAGLLGLVLIGNAILPVSGVSLAFVTWLVLSYSVLRRLQTITRAHTGL